jgi:hypothetical protein
MSKSTEKNAKADQLAQAKAALAKDKQDRATAFQKELEALCKKYRCTLQPQLTIQPLD